MNLVLTHENVHNAEHLLYLVVGYLYLLPLIGSEPIRWRLSYPIRLIFLFIAMPVDAFTGVALGSYSSDPFPVTSGMRSRTWGPSPLDDVHIGGAVMWVGGSAIMFVLIMFTFLAWTRQSQSVDSRGWLETARRVNLEQLTASHRGGHGRCTRSQAHPAPVRHRRGRGPAGRLQRLPGPHQPGRPRAAVLTRARSVHPAPIRAGMRDTPVALSTKI